MRDGDGKMVRSMVVRLGEIRAGKNDGTSAAPALPGMYLKLEMRRPTSCRERRERRGKDSCETVQWDERGPAPRLVKM